MSVPVMIGDGPLATVEGCPCCSGGSGCQMCGMDLPECFEFDLTLGSCSDCPFSGGHYTMMRNHALDCTQPTGCTFIYGSWDSNTPTIVGGVTCYNNYVNLTIGIYYCGGCGGCLFITLTFIDNTPCLITTIPCSFQYQLFNVSDIVFCTRPIVLPLQHAENNPCCAGNTCLPTTLTISAC